MSLNTLTAADLKKIISLVERKETLQAQVAKIDAELATYEGAQPAQATTGTQGRKLGLRAQRKAPRSKGVKRGAVTEKIIEMIKGAGKAGITVKEIAAKLGVNYNRVFTWFYRTGKKIKAIKKVGPGKYEWVGVAKPVVEKAEASKPVPPVKPIKRAAPAKAKGGKAGVTKERIVELLKSAGKDGITVKDVARKLGIKRNRIDVWFGRTGKTVQAIKKIAPGKYAWVS